MSFPSLEELRSYPQVQQPTNDDLAARDEVLKKLRSLPPLVFAGECDDLRAQLAEVAEGRAFLLQGGDCAETFDTVNAQNIKHRLQVLLSMAIVMIYAAQVPVVKVGRIAGQYAKPRSKDNETRGDVSLPSYRGDAINGFEFTAEARKHDPRRLLRTYNASAATLNLVRAFTKGGFADLRGLHAWNKSFASQTGVDSKYEALADEITRALAFMVACKVPEESIATVDFFSSHEALVLDYEHALTRIDSRSQLPYGCSGHMLWVGERTREPDGAHIELLSKIQNPVGVKIGPTANGDEVVELVNRLDPDHVPGRVTVITRLGADKVRDVLPGIIKAVEATGRKVVWSCDPMHGNTHSTANGYKTREYAKVVAELDAFFDIHDELGTWPGGVHIELTGDDVTECTGGVFQLSESDLENRYETYCDPRLNRDQALELAFMISDRLSERRAKHPDAVDSFQPLDF